MSVRLITPVRRPEILAPGRAAAETALGNTPLSDGDAGVELWKGTAWVGSGERGGGDDNRA